MADISKALLEGGALPSVGWEELFRIGPVPMPSRARPLAYDPNSGQRILSFYEDDVEIYRDQWGWKLMQRSLLFGLGGLVVAALVCSLAR